MDSEEGMAQEMKDPQEEFRQKDGSFLVTGEMIIQDVIGAFPKAAGVMLRYGLHCVGCHANAFDTVEGGAKLHGMREEEIAEMIAEINETINKRIETIEMTERAAKKVLELREQEKGKEDWPLRVAVTPGGCSGFGYEMDFDERKSEDILVEQHGVAVVIDPESMEMLRGSSIDYIDGLNAAGFKIDNPNASRSCGCGKSFG